MSRLKPKPTTADGERGKLVDFQRQALCDIVIERAVALMVESGASAEMICERLLTHMTVRAAEITPQQALARAFEKHANDIQTGVFHRVNRTAGRQH